MTICEKPDSGRNKRSKVLLLGNPTPDAQDAASAEIHIAKEEDRRHGGGCAIKAGGRNVALLQGKEEESARRKNNAKS